MDQKQMILDALKNFEELHNYDEKIKDVEIIICYLLDGINEQNFSSAQKFLESLCEKYVEVKIYIHNNPIPFNQWSRKNDILFQQLTRVGLLIALKGAFESQQGS